MITHSARTLFCRVGKKTILALMVCSSIFPATAKADKLDKGRIYEIIKKASPKAAKYAKKFKSSSRQYKKAVATTRINSKSMTAAPKLIKGGYRAEVGIRRYQKDGVVVERGIYVPSYATYDDVYKRAIDEKQRIAQSVKEQNKKIEERSLIEMERSEREKVRLLPNVYDVSGYSNIKRRYEKSMYADTTPDTPPSCKVKSSNNIPSYFK